MQKRQRVRVVEWTERDAARAEPMEVEFVGGPYDGTRLHLYVVREGSQHLAAGDGLRVLEMTYTRLPPGKPATPVEITITPERGGTGAQVP